jgi:hypothetical protein
MPGSTVTVAPSLVQPAGWRDVLTVRSPRLVVLQPHWLLSWVVLGGGAAWVGGRVAASSVSGYMEPQLYVRAWFLAALLAASWWCYTQWRSRTSLPHHQPLGIWLSPGTATLTVAFIFSVVPLAGLSVAHYIGTRPTREEVAGVRLVANRPAWFAQAITRVEIDPFDPLQIKRWNLDAVNAELERHLSARALRSARSCLAESPGVVACLRSGDPKCWPHTEEALKTCHIEDLSRLLSSSIRQIDLCRPGPDDDYPCVAAPITLYRLAFWTVFVGLFAGCGALVHFEDAMIVVAAIWVPGRSLPNFARLLMSLFKRSWPQLTHDWRSWLWIGYVAFVVVLACACIRRPERSRLRNAGVLVALLGPILILDVDNSLDVNNAPSSDPFSAYSWLVFGGSVLLGFLSTPLLSRYRRLPWST